MCVRGVIVHMFVWNQFLGGGRPEPDRKWFIVMDHYTTHIGRIKICARLGPTHIRHYTSIYAYLDNARRIVLVAGYLAVVFEARLSVFAAHSRSSKPVEDDDFY